MLQSPANRNRKRTDISTNNRSARHDSISVTFSRHITPFSIDQCTRSQETGLAMTSMPRCAALRSTPAHLKQKVYTQRIVHRSIDRLTGRRTQPNRQGPQTVTVIALLLADLWDCGLVFVFEILYSNLFSMALRLTKLNTCPDRLGVNIVLSLLPFLVHENVSHQHNSF